MLSSKYLLVPGLAMAMAAGAFSQTDDCAAPTDFGSGVFATVTFDSMSFTTSGFDGGGSCPFGSTTINQDAFGFWTAPGNGTLTVDTFGSTIDTKLSLHDGGDCSATCLGYNDDTGGLQSEVAIAVTAGQMILIQSGGFGSNAGSITCNVVFGVDPCLTIIDDAFEDNDTCATAGAAALGLTTNNVGLPGDSDWWTVTIPTDNILTLTLTETSGNTDINVLAGDCVTVFGSAAGSFTFTNTSGADLDVAMEFFAVAGIQACSEYDFDVALGVDPCSPSGTPDDAFEDNDDCATATALVDGTYPGLYVNLADKDHYSFSVDDGATVQIDITFTNADGDLDGFLRAASSVECGNGNGADELADGFTGTDNELITWTNNTGASLDVVLEVNVWDNAGNANCNSYDLTITGTIGCGVGITICDPANDNCLGRPTVLCANFGSGVGSDLHLTVKDGPSSEFGYFLVSVGCNDPGIVLSRGKFCLSDGVNPFGRYNLTGTASNSIGQSSADGSTWTNLVGTGTSAGGEGFDVPSIIPIVGQGMIMSGETWYFQLWHRDAGCDVAGSSNFSNAICITFP